MRFYHFQAAYAVLPASGKNCNVKIKIKGPGPEQAEGQGDRGEEGKEACLTIPFLTVTTAPGDSWAP